MSLNDSQQKERAEQMVERFVRRFQPSYRLLAYHAALPLVLTPELVNYLRVQFLQGVVPWVGEVDLLLSDLCKQVGYELYAMDTAVRAYLLEKMKRELGEGRMQEVARLLISYVKYLHQNNPYISSKELEAQQWAAMLYLEEPRQQAVREIAEAFQVFGTSTTGQGLINKAELARLAGITTVLAPQLKAYPNLVDYAALVSRVLAEAIKVNRKELRRSYKVLPDIELHLPEELIPTDQLTVYEFGYYWFNSYYEYIDCYCTLDGWHSDSKEQGGVTWAFGSGIELPDTIPITENQFVLGVEPQDLVNLQQKGWTKLDFLDNYGGIIWVTKDFRDLTEDDKEMINNRKELKSKLYTGIHDYGWSDS